MCMSVTSNVIISFKDRNVMIPKKVDTKKNLADLFTKGLSGEQLDRMTKSWVQGCETGVFVQLHSTGDERVFHFNTYDMIHTVVWM